jgi:hypothetical protein
MRSKNSANRAPGIAKQEKKNDRKALLPRIQLDDELLVDDRLHLFS